MTKNETKDNIFGEVISQYTRAQAIEDGNLIDVTHEARKAGIPFPTALTATVWDHCVDGPKETRRKDEMSRLREVLRMVRSSFVSRCGYNEVVFSLRVRDDARYTRTERLKAFFGRGDTGEHVITVMLLGCDD